MWQGVPSGPETRGVGGEWPEPSGRAGLARGICSLPRRPLHVSCACGRTPAQRVPAVSPACHCARCPGPAMRPPAFRRQTAFPGLVLPFRPLWRLRRLPSESRQPYSVPPVLKEEVPKSGTRSLLFPPPLAPKAVPVPREGPARALGTAPRSSLPWPLSGLPLDSSKEFGGEDQCSPTTGHLDPKVFPDLRVENSCGLSTGRICVGPGGHQRRVDEGFPNAEGTRGKDGERGGGGGREGPACRRMAFVFQKGPTPARQNPELSARLAQMPQVQELFHEAAQQVGKRGRACARGDLSGSQRRRCTPSALKL